jgi:hypothetical protein
LAGVPVQAPPPLRLRYAEVRIGRRSFNEHRGRSHFAGGHEQVFCNPPLCARPQRYAATLRLRSRRRSRAADARTIGRGARRLKLRIGNVLSSPFCRTRETARLAFGRFRISQALLNTITAEHDASWRRQIRAARRLLGRKPAPGKLTVLVTHGSVVGDTTGQTLEEGETLVFRPLGSSRFRLLGRILPREWRTLGPA